MNVAIMFLLKGTPLLLKKMEESPQVGDEVVIGKTTTPKLYVVKSRRFLDSNDDFTRIDITVEEVKPKRGTKS